jgi:enediyne biosynthesis protein E4
MVSTRLSLFYLMSAAPPSPVRPAPAAGSPGREAWPPLLPLVLTLVLAAIALSLLFAWLFPAGGAALSVPPARFTEITAPAGLHYEPDPDSPASPTTLGGGVVVLDYDGDGHPDVLFVQGTPWPWDEALAKRSSRSSLALWHNDGRGHFTDVTAGAGLNVALQGMTAVAGDYDNDGRPDLFVTCVGLNHLFRNLGSGRFVDVTESAGIGGEENTWSTGATWLDVDHDGRLDLVVAHYARWPREVPLAMAFTIAEVGRSYGTPTGFVGVPPSVYRNLGDGRFALVAGAAGLLNVDSATGLPTAKALAVVPVDANGDGRLDLIFSYHTSDDAIFLNQGDGTFAKWAGSSDQRNEGAAAGLATASLLPLAEAPNTDDRMVVLRSLTTSEARNRGESPLQLRGKLGGVLIDYDLSGQLALFTGNGRAEPDVNKFADGRDFAAVPQLLFSRGGQWVAAPAAGGWSRPLIARGIASADLDGDGDSDVIFAQNHAAPMVLRNDQRNALPWLRLRLVASHGPSEAGGARVEVHTPRRIFRQTAAPPLGFMAQSESVLTFGLGEDARVRKIFIRWPSGQRQEVRPVAINRTLVIREP